MKWKQLALGLLVSMLSPAGDGWAQAADGGGWRRLVGL